MAFFATSFASDAQPNVLIAISDDVSFPHASAYGCKMVQTPAFDQVAKQGILFNNAYCGAPGCSPSRASLLTGRHIWMIEEAGTHASYFQKKYVTFPEALAQAGYFVGNTGKAWGPGNFKQGGRQQNPAGPSFSGKGKGDFVGGFRKFLEQRPNDAPFCFWFGGNDAHRPYKKESGIQSGLNPETVDVPGYLPDHPEIRSDLLDYAFEVNRFDADVNGMLKLLETAGELDNTLVIYTSDNGMPFPRAKANCYDSGIHMPLAVSWPKQFPKGRVSDDLVGFVDLTATIYEACQVTPETNYPVVGRSLVDVLKSDAEGIMDPKRDCVVSGRERHSSSRFNSLSYPIRAIRTREWLYIVNDKPERWPAGPGQKYSTATYDDSGHLVASTLSGDHDGYHDIDACPTLSFLIEHAENPEYSKYLQLAVARRPAEELFHLPSDPDCLNNLASNPDHASIREQHAKKLAGILDETKDPRRTGNGDIWETYPRVSGLRWFPKPQWAQENSDQVPAQEWLDRRRPRPKK